MGVYLKVDSYRVTVLPWIVISQHVHLRGYMNTEYRLKGLDD